MDLILNILAQACKLRNPLLSGSVSKGVTPSCVTVLHTYLALLIVLSVSTDIQQEVSTSSQSILTWLDVSYSSTSGLCAAIFRVSGNMSDPKRQTLSLQSFLLYLICLLTS